MRTYFYRFGYETPSQLEDNKRSGRDDEDSQSVLIAADSEEAALRWGEEIAERFMKRLFRDDTVSWKQLGYASWIETEGSDPVKGIPLVNTGEFPDVSKWLPHA